MVITTRISYGTVPGNGDKVFHVMTALTEDLATGRVGGCKKDTFEAKRCSDVGTEQD